MKKELGIFLLLAALVAIACSRAEWQFLSSYNLFNLLRNVSLYGIFGIGLGMVIITGGIDLSVGSLFAMLGVTLAMLISEQHWPWPLAVLVVIAGCAVVGAFHGFMIAKVRMQPFIVTLCGLLVYRGLARYIAGDMTKGFGDRELGVLEKLVTGRMRVGVVYDWMPTGLHDFLHTRLGDTAIQVPYAFFVMMTIAIIMWVVLHKSIYGRYLMAVGRNEDAARYSGINAKLVIGSAYVICCVLGGIAGILLAVDTRSIGPADFGNSYELYGIAAAVLGGCSLRGGEGSIVGIIIGAAILQTLQNMVNLLHIRSELNFAVIGTVIFIGVLVDELIKQRNQKKIKKA